MPARLAPIDITNPKRLHHRLTQGASLNVPDIDGLTPLFQACLVSESESARLLLTAGADPEIADPKGRRPLFHSVGVGDGEMVKVLILGGTDVNAYAELDGQWWTALHLAASMGYPRIVQSLIEAGADVEAASEPDGATPLHVAAEMGLSCTLRALCELGANTRSLDRQGRSPLARLEAGTNDPATKAALIRHRHIHHVWGGGNGAKGHRHPEVRCAPKSCL